MSDSASILELFNQLCDIHLGSTKRVHRVQPSISRAEYKKRLKKTLFNALFRHLFEVKRAGNNAHSPIGQEIEGVLLQIGKLRKQNLQKEANRLDFLFQKLRKDENDGIQNCLHFLVALKDCGESHNKKTIGEESLCVPELHDVKTENLVTHQGPLSYRMGMLPVAKGTHFYLQYPMELFENCHFNFQENERTLEWVFNSTPGCCISECSFFTNTDDNTSLSSAPKRHPDGKKIQLELPDFQATPEFRVPEFQGSKSNSSTELSEVDSGQSSMSGSMVSVVDQSAASSDSMWDDALTEVRSQHYTWEWIGFQSGPTERPYLTEAGSRLFDALVRVRQHALSIAGSTHLELIAVDSLTLTKHVLLMLIGVPSWIFPFDQETHSFCITSGIHLSGLSPEMLASAVQPFLQFGSYFHRLSYFARTPDSSSSFYTSGLVFEAFAVAVRNVLSHYTAAILEIPYTLTLLQLGVHLHFALEQIGYMAKLCQVHEGPPQDPQVSGFPLGMKLLTYMFHEAQAASCCSHYPILLSILNTTWSPFMLYIKDWVFHGVHNDRYKEFMIDMDLKSLDKRDNEYWEGAYTLAQGCSTPEDLPQFLQALVKDIVTCGKSINLMRLCNPQHFLCNVSDSVIPSVGISFSQTDLTSMEQYCHMYVQCMQQVARSISEDRMEVRKREKRQKKELKETAKKVAEDEIARLQGIIVERKRKLDAKKREEFKRLKEQMETDLERRSEEERQNQEEDRQFVARLAREEDALTKEEIELEAKARDDLIAYYAGLSEEAMHRERKALWKVRRMRLDTARSQLLSDMSEKWAKEMKELTEGKSILDSVDSGNIPKWADRSSKELPIVVGEEEEGISLPAWAKRVSQPDPVEFTPTTMSTDGLPNWAVRGMNESTVEVARNTIEQEEGKVEESEGTMTESSREFKTIHIEGKASAKPHIKASVEMNASKETEESQPQLHSRQVEGKHISSQSSDSFDTGKICIKKVEGVDMLKQTEEQRPKVHIKTSAVIQATTETEEIEQKSSIKMQEGIAVNKESTEERQIIPKRGRLEDGSHISQQTKSQVLSQRKPSLFGHVSQMSRAEHDYGIPRLRRHVSQHASSESDYKDFGIKPRIRMNAKMSATVESEKVESSSRPTIRINANLHANLESVVEDDHLKGIARFRQRNFRGHASDSTVQRLLYGVQEFPMGKAAVKNKEENLEPLPRVELKPGDLYQTESYASFHHLENKPCSDLMSTLNIADVGQNYLDSSSLNEDEVDAYKYRPLSSLLARAVASPIRAQVILVDRAIINYFTSELKVEEHLAAIRRYVFMADGDFAQILSDILIEKLATKPLPKEILNPLFLKTALTKAIRSSMHSDDPYSQRLSFRLLHMPQVLMPNEPQSLNCLDLKYTVEWPLNIIFTESCMDKYSVVFSFLLQIKRVVWNLKDVWHRLKRDALISKAGKSSHFLKIQLYRQEMEHFMKMMQGYVTSQVIQVTWQELQTELARDIAGLDELRGLHENYLQKAVCRCLLDKRASRVMKIILNIFCLILKFRTQLLSSNWQQDKHGQIIHPQFPKMVETYNAFHSHSLFLFKVVHILSQKGYQPHLQELLIQLNFNDFYSEMAK